MKIKSYLSITLLSLLFLSGCGLFHSHDDIKLEFDDFSECPADIYADIVVDSSNLPAELNEGYIYIYSFGDSKYHVVFHNPDYGYGEEEFISVDIGPSVFYTEDDYFYRTMIPEKYYIYSIEYINFNVCTNVDELAIIQNEYNKSFIFYSEDYYIESGFKEEFSTLFD